MEQEIDSNKTVSEIFILGIQPGHSFYKFWCARFSPFFGGGWKEQLLKYSHCLKAFSSIFSLFLRMYISWIYGSVHFPKSMKRRILVHIHCRLIGYMSWISSSSSVLIASDRRLCVRSLDRFGSLGLFITRLGPEGVSPAQGEGSP